MRFIRIQYECKSKATSLRGGLVQQKLIVHASKRSIQLKEIVILDKKLIYEEQL